MSNRPRNNDRSQLLSEQENESIFNALGRGCQSLSTAVVQLYLAEPSNRQQWSKRCCGVVCFVKDNSKRSYFIRLYDPKSKEMAWEQELYMHFHYKAPRDFFHTFEAHDCQAGLNFASEDEAAKFKKAVEYRLMERHKKKLEKKKQQEGLISQAQQVQHPGSGTISVGSGPLPAAASVNLGSKPATNTVKVDKKKDKKGKKKLTKEDIGTPTDFRHVSHAGWDADTGFDMKKLDPEMKTLFEQIGMDDQSQVDEETIDFIYDFVDKHGGLNAVREDLARRQPPPPPPSQSSALPPPVSRMPAPSMAGGRPPPPPVRSQAVPPPAPDRGTPTLGRQGMAAPPPPPGRQGIGVPPPPPKHPAALPPLPSTRDAGPPSVPGARVGASPPPPPANIPAPPPPPPAAPAAPPPPPVNVGPPAPPSGRAGLLNDIHKGTQLKHVEAGSGLGGSMDARGSLLSAIRGGTTLRPVDHSSTPAVQEAPTGIVGALAAALAARKNVIQGSDDEEENSSEDSYDDDEEWDD